MPKRSSNPPKDVNEAAAAAVARLTGEASPEPKKNRHAVALGRRGGKIGGPARAKMLNPERRKEIARQAAQARWAKRPKQ